MTLTIVLSIIALVSGRGVITDTAFLVWELFSCFLIKIPTNGQTDFENRIMTFGLGEGLDFANPQ